MQLRAAAELVREAIGPRGRPTGEECRPFRRQPGVVHDQEREPDGEAQEEGLCLHDGVPLDGEIHVVDRDTARDEERIDELLGQVRLKRIAQLLGGV